MNEPVSSQPGACAPILPRDQPCVFAEAPPARPSLLAALLDAADADERRRVVSSALYAIGFDWLVHGRLAPVDGRIQPVSLRAAHADLRWTRRYEREGHCVVDARLHDALRSSLPCSWTLDGLRQRCHAAPPDSPVRRFVADLADTGMRSGAMFVLGGTERHVVSLLSRRETHDCNEAPLLGQVLAIGLCVHEYYSRWSDEPPGPAATLTAVQRDILGQVARGASDKQIAYDLQLSSHAVDYHMRQLRRRFAVRNRVQLTQAAQFGAGPQAPARSVPTPP